MVRGSGALLSKGSGSISEVLSNVLVCPLSKQPLRQCQNSQSMISGSLGVSFPIVDGIPCLLPKDGKLLEDQQMPRHENGVDPSLVKSTP
ncbi:hypothetical protein J5N97_022758 [Dioscorea zingiberensis]|uniref:Protein preY, mitochondrial n=1 Tax=Dioscorea zingiberensis TaxID=325984 RepID=A0A9D5CB60_9LILI|nr:hypothetical protein J5N97_022758 [Dioscorea zingiberensis]